MGRRPIPERELVYRGPLSPLGQNHVVPCCISPPFGRLSTTPGKVIYVLLTRAPLYRGLPPFSCDLHVLGAPLTFALSQDQTLQLNVEPTVRTAGFYRLKRSMAHDQY
jgi:hypothetical protein